MEFLVGAVSVIGATLLVFVYLVFIWWLDRYEREPFWLVLIAFAFGGVFGTAFGCSISSVPGAVAILALGPEAGGFVGATVIAPLVEEFTKALVFVGLILTKHFDNETDGLIYGAATGLGFACIENLVYFAGAEDLEQLVSMAILRTLFTAVVHATSSAILGMAIGYARRRGLGRGFVIVGMGYAAAVINHAVWNTLASASGFQAMQETGLSPVLSLIGCGLVALAACVMFGITQLSLKREHDIIRRYLAAEAAQGTIPEEHVAIIPYWLKRRGNDWARGVSDKEAYIKSATLLAFRQYQLEDAEGQRRERILGDIATHRQKLKELRLAA